MPVKNQIYHSWVGCTPQGVAKVLIDFLPLSRVIRVREEMTQMSYATAGLPNAMRMEVLLDQIEEYDAWLDGWDAMRLEGEGD